MRKSMAAERRSGEHPGVFYDLRLYVANTSPRSLNAVAAAKRICRERLAGRFRLAIIDIKKEPRRAVEDQIVAVPALVRMGPEPHKVLIGDLRDTGATLAGLGL